MEGDVVEPQCQIHGSEEGIPTQSGKTVSLMGQRVSILDGLGIEPAEVGADPQSPDFFQTMTSGEAYSLIDLLIMPFISISDSTSLNLW